jgi:hypothetical protein
MQNEMNRETSSLSVVLLLLPRRNQEILQKVQKVITQQKNCLRSIRQQESVFLNLVESRNYRLSRSRAGSTLRRKLLITSLVIANALMA